MAQGTYTRTNLITFLNSRIGGKKDQLLDVNTLIDSAVRFVINDIDLRGTKRKSTLTPNLFDDIYDYTLPSDCKSVIDIIPQVEREENTEWDFLPEEEFDRKKTRLDNIFTITGDDLVRRIRISRKVDDKSVVLARMESLNGDGDTWVGFGSVDDTSVKKDGDNYIKGNGAVRFEDNGDTAATTVGLQNRGIDEVDLSEYLANGSIFVRSRLTTGDADITKLTVRLGSDSDNYYEVSDSTTNENTPFETGWNLVRLDLSNKSKNGNPTDTAIDYIAAFWTKTANTHLTDTDYAFDHIEVKKGKIYNLLYYSRYMWQSGSTYQENSDSDGNTLSLFNDEIELIVTKAWELASYELKNYNDAAAAKALYKELKEEYLKRHPSEAKVMVSIPFEFGTVVGRRGYKDSSDSTDT